jgi:hypothetical protein
MFGDLPILWTTKDCQVQIQTQDYLIPDQDLSVNYTFTPQVNNTELSSS